MGQLKKETEWRQLIWCTYCSNLHWLCWSEDYTWMNTYGYKRAHVSCLLFVVQCPRVCHKHRRFLPIGCFSNTKDLMIRKIRCPCRWWWWHSRFRVCALVWFCLRSLALFCLFDGMMDGWMDQSYQSTRCGRFDVWLWWQQRLVPGIGGQTNRSKQSSSITLYWYKLTAWRKDTVASRRRFLQLPYWLRSP